MNAVGVEYEKRFVNEANENIKHLQKIYGDKNLGKAVCTHGDARDLSFLDEKVGSIFFSPPYFDALSVNKGGGSKTSILYEETTQDLQMKRSGPFAVKKNLPTPYSSKRGNVGNIPARAFISNNFIFRPFRLMKLRIDELRSCVSFIQHTFNTILD